MRWQEASRNAIHKAQRLEATPELQADGTWHVPSASEPGEHWTVRIMGRKDHPAAFWCDCRDVHPPQPPAGWVGCWHAGAVAIELTIEGFVRLDLRNGLTANQNLSWVTEMVDDPFAGLAR